MRIQPTYIRLSKRCKFKKKHFPLLFFSESYYAAKAVKIRRPKRPKKQRWISIAIFLPHGHRAIVPNVSKLRSLLRCRLECCCIFVSQTTIRQIKVWKGILDSCQFSRNSPSDYGVHGTRWVKSFTLYYINFLITMRWGNKIWGHLMPVGE